MIHDEDLKVMAEKLYNDIIYKIDNYYELNEVETSKILEYLISMFRKHFIHYD